MDYKKEIIKELEKILSSGQDQSRIYSDWLDMVYLTLEMLPRHVQSVVASKSFAQDDEETKKVFDRLHASYKDNYFEHFSKAFCILMDSAEQSWEDVIGAVYMEWGMPNKHTGQFFTPYHLAKMMAEMTVDPEEAFRRLHDAYLKTSAGAMHKFIAEQEGKPERVYDFVKSSPESVIPFCAEHFEPITISDPACGSGVMLLSAAECFPDWARKWGFVQFYGQDIDPDCVKMCKINIMLHGLNGYSLKLEVAAGG